MGEVAIQSVKLPSAQETEAATIISVIERAARDPSVDIDKMERLLQMRRDMMAVDAERIFNRAMKAAQAEMRPIGADATNPQTRSKYATYAKLDGVLRPIYTSHGFSLSFDEADCPKPDYIRILCYVAHEDGHTRIYRKDMPSDGKGAKGGDVMTKTHAAGAAASYGARYLLKGIFNIAVGDEDRDGNDVSGATDAPEAITATQVAELRELLDSTNSDVRRFCAHFKVQSLAGILAKDFDRARGMIERKRGAQ